jgi:hypothetical protein
MSTEVNVKIKNITASMIVTQKRVFSIPRRAEKTPPVSVLVNPPRPMPLFCRITLAMRAIEVIIKAMLINEVKVNLLD